MNLKTYLQALPGNTASGKENGAAKKLSSGGINFLSAFKIRNLKTGNVDIRFYGDEIKNKKLLIIDDICDGGQTFIKLSELLLEQGASQVDLYITHPIFRNGFDIFKDKISNIYTYNDVGELLCIAL